MHMQQTVFVGMSGGVDSSVAALLLQQQGYRVVGVYLKCWDSDEAVFGTACQWRSERRDALQVAARLKIPLRTYDFTEAYARDVMDYLFREYAAGRTPNPDVMCNRSIKFGLFFERARREGADYIATGHYASRIIWQNEPTFAASADTAKDQTYFLWSLRSTTLRHVLFPLGDITKPEVRRLAREADLPTADKPDSQGICFVGGVALPELLRTRIPERPGVVVTTRGVRIGEHRGAAFYTIGQRHGLALATGLPHYVVATDVATNVVTVGEGAVDSALYRTELKCEHVSWVNDPPTPGRTYQARIRYRQPLQDVVLQHHDGTWHCHFLEPQRAVTAGQSIVFYEDRRVVGGGVIANQEPQSQDRFSNE